MSLSVKLVNPFGKMKVKGDSPSAVKETVESLRDLAPKPIDLPDDSIPRALRTSRQLPSIPKKFRFKGSNEM